MIRLTGYRGCVPGDPPVAPEGCVHVTHITPSLSYARHFATPPRVLHRAEVLTHRPFYLQRDENAMRLAAVDGHDPGMYQTDGIAEVPAAVHAWLTSQRYDVIVVDHEQSGEIVYVALFPEHVTLTPPADLGWLRSHAASIAYPRSRFVVHPAPPGFHLELRAVALDAETGERAEQCSRPWYLGPWTTESDLVRAAMACVLAYEEHEARERFRYRGKALFGPHVDVQALAQVT